MAKVKNKRENHVTKRGTYGHGYGPKDSQEAGRGCRGQNAGGAGQNSGRGQGTGRPHSSNSKGGRASGSDNSNRGYRDREFQGYDSDFAQAPSNIICGRNPVTEALKSGREIDKLVVSSTEGSMIKILAMAKDAGIPIMKAEKATLDRLAPGQAHQGVAAYISPYEYAEMDDIFALAASRNEDPFIIILDNLEDPHNLGAIMRTAECSGAHGVIIPKRRACGLTETVAKASAGAIEYMPCVKVTNISQTIDELKERGVWIAACDMGGEEYYKANLKGAIAVVIGSEGFGISKLVKEKCDFIVSMPMVGRITSLNASNAAAVIMYEIRKQRDNQ